jgi:WD40 repeat protein
MSMRIVAAAIALAALATDAHAEGALDQRPMLRIEPGMHTAMIRRISVDASCSTLVSASDDKTARIWSLPKGGRGAMDLVRTLRVPLGDGHQGRVNAVAISPDGKWIAAGGWDAKWSVERSMNIYIFETDTGRIVTTLGPLGEAYYHLAISGDGTRLAVTMNGGKGMQLWDTATWQQMAADPNYGGKDAYGAVFDSSNRLFTVSYDGQIRRYNAAGKLEANAATAAGKLPYGIAVHPKGRRIAVTFDDSKSVEIYDTGTLKRVSEADTSSIPRGNFYGVTWSADGSRLFAGGRGYQVNGRHALLIWDEEGRKQAEVPLSKNSILELMPCGRDAIAAAATDPAVGVLTLTGAKRAWQENVTADMRDKKRDNFAMSYDTKQVRFGLGQGRDRPVTLDLTAFELTDSPEKPDGFMAPDITGLDITDWENNAAPKLSGKPIQLQTYEIARSVAVAPDASRFALGADWSLRAYRADGTKLWDKQAPGAPWGVNISGDGKLLVAATGDGTLRWYRLADGKELLALFVHAKDRRFVAWTPKGYYAASPGAEDLIGWNVNRDFEHAADFFPAARFRDRFNRPDIVKRVLDDRDEDRAIAEANRLAGSKPPPEDMAKKLPPVITILSPPGEGFSQDAVTLRYALRSPSGQPVSQVAALVDGRPLPGGQFRGPSNVSANSDAETTITLSGLPQRDIALSLVASSGGLESTPATVRLKYEGAKQPSPTQAQQASMVSLYALVVGVGKFKEAKIDSLAWAGKDARDFAAALQAQQGKLYRKVEVKLLADEDADSGSILDGLTWLQRQVGQGDVGVVFLAGHGVTAPSGDYYYIPYNARVETVAGVTLPTRGSSVPDTEISHTLKQLVGNALFFFDTCHAGKATGVSFRGALDYNKLINEIAGSANAVVLASSTGSELSMESEEWQHGAFTKALLEGIAGAADVLPKDGVVTVDELNLYVKERVKELTGGLQHPVDLKPKEARNVPFAMP